MKSMNNKKLPLWLIILLAGFPQLSETIYSPALPAITTSLQTNNHWVQWTLSIYFMGFASGVFIWGRVSDYTGRRFAMLFGIIVYLVGSLICLFSSSIGCLFIARAIQAFGANAGSVITQTMLREYFSEKERGRIFASMAIALSFAPAIGPVIGGVLSHYFGWRSNFLVLLLIVVIILFLSYLYLPETLIPVKKVVII
ncbi:MFS transporter [Piscirickettsia litoralis]|uniref:MFS transporter n=1 Tax=Piscirickettsia litoralis TaxID=1891921 RepID=UPI000980E744|nr:MFS transporter [Piscirickettsia litoralis]